ncbi:hypothetical protein [Arthrobacter globiformis]|uniref:hypothetical protein n=1 Tax=Arthrobacter globiformis TaxID=1665 RepID=UPI002793BD90|nr:hypothetical protein [Arthrobacter globiformis]MDQ0618738.1 hypothetical protein [Arthrobacter globiformis]
MEIVTENVTRFFHTPGLNRHKPRPTDGRHHAQDAYVPGCGGAFRPRMKDMTEKNPHLEELGKFLKTRRSELIHLPSWTHAVRIFNPRP